MNPSKECPVSYLHRRMQDGSGHTELNGTTCTCRTPVSGTISNSSKRHSLKFSHLGNLCTLAPITRHSTQAKIIIKSTRYRPETRLTELTIQEIRTLDLHRLNISRELTIVGALYGIIYNIRHREASLVLIYL